MSDTGLNPNPLNLSAAEILATSHYAKLFPVTERVATLTYRLLVKKWHPDHHFSVTPQEKDELTAVMSKLSTLFELAKDAIKTGTWNDPDYIVRTTLDQTEIRYKLVNPVDLGSFATRSEGKDRYFYLVPKGNRDLAEAWQATVKQHADGPKEEMWQKKFAHTLDYPPIFRDLADGETLIQARFPTDYVTLRKCIQERLFTAPHAAWLMTRLYQEILFMVHTKTVNLDLSLDSVLVNTQLHTIQLIDGWQYSVKFENGVTAPLRAAPSIWARKPSVIQTRTVTLSQLFDHAKSLVKECMGDREGINLQKDNSIPPTLLSRLNTPGLNDAFQELDLWYKTLNSVYPQRGFTPW